MRQSLAFKPEPFSWPLTPEWEGEVSRSSPDYVRWVQSSLNKILGLRLAVDGIVGPATRSAIRSFQQRQQLVVDGIVGPNTEAALIAAGASPPAMVAAADGGAPVSVVPECSRLAYGKNCHFLYFDFNKDAPTPPIQDRPKVYDQDAHEEKLFEIAERVISSWETSQPVNSLLILGHASPEGSDEYNYDLANRRAFNVSEALAAQMEELELGSGSRIDLQLESCGEEALSGVSAELRRRVQVCFQPPPRWFETGGSPPMQPVWAGNDVKYLIDGTETFQEMVAAIETATKPGHYIYLLGWWLSDGFPLTRGKLDLWSLFKKASGNGVQIRAMLWDQKSGCPNPSEHVQNTAEVNHINEWLSMGQAILDDRTLPYGSHHQKILVVKGKDGLIAFCGGVDINPDRIVQGGPTPGAPFHDVHCRIKGPAAHEVLKIFRQRWEDHPGHAGLEEDPALQISCPYKWKRTDHCALLGLEETRPPWEGEMYVQIGRTYGNGMRHSGVPGGYSFARDGEQTARRMVLKAIREAQQFIYIEDQYLVSTEISRALIAALPRIHHLTILIPDGSITTMAMVSCLGLGEQVRFRRHEFIRPLRAAAPGKVGVFFLAPAGSPRTYVHSKMMVVDDEYAIIGSANLNRRSLTHDSEVIAGIYDPSPDSLAKRLRIDLWANHLGMNNPADRAKLTDGVASVKYWYPAPRGARPSTARVAPYDENIGVESRHPDGEWNKIDPDGS